MTIYTDGSCRANGKKENMGAWGFVAYEGNQEIYRAAARVRNTTNNRMEMQAIIEALKWLVENGKDGVVCMDSALCYNGITQWMDGWKARGWCKADKHEVLNKDLWLEIDELIQRAPAVVFEKVKGHCDCAGNNVVDKMVQDLSGGKE